MKVTNEAIGQQVVGPQRGCRIAGAETPELDGLTGRPRRAFGLTSEGDHLFAKRYADLGVEIIDTVAAELEPAGLQRVLATLTRGAVRRWRPLLEGLSVRQRSDAPRGIYQAEDAFTRWKRGPTAACD